MTFYVYDGTFDGLMSIVYEIYKIKSSEDKIITYSESEKIILGEKFYGERNDENSTKVIKSIISKLSYDFLAEIMICFLSEEDGMENIIFDFIKKGFTEGKEVAKNFSDNTIKKVHEISRRVGCEIHRMKGLLRFSRLNNGIFYAPLEPDYNISGLIIKHFMARLSDQKWIIHDVKRGILFYYDKEKCEEVDTSKLIFDKDFFECQDETEVLWKQYHKSIAITERKNPRLQRQFMPQRYWKYLTEKR